VFKDCNTQTIIDINIHKDIICTEEYSQII
jgi:hypothetical protein